MPKVIARPNESFNVTLKRFKKSCQRASLLSEIKKNRFYEKPSDKKRKAVNKAKRKEMKRKLKRRRYR